MFSFYLIILLSRSPVKWLNIIGVREYKKYNVVLCGKTLILSLVMAGVKLPDLLLFRIGFQGVVFSDTLSKAL